MSRLLRTILAFACLALNCARADTVLVLPFFNVSNSASLDWIGESIAETIRESLVAQGVLALDREDRQEGISAALGASLRVVDAGFGGQDCRGARCGAGDVRAIFSDAGNRIEGLAANYQPDSGPQEDQAGAAIFRDGRARRPGCARNAPGLAGRGRIRSQDRAVGRGIPEVPARAPCGCDRELRARSAGGLP